MGSLPFNSLTIKDFLHKTRLTRWLWRLTGSGLGFILIAGILNLMASNSELYTAVRIYTLGMLTWGVATAGFGGLTLIILFLRHNRNKPITELNRLEQYSREDDHDLEH